MSHRFSVSYPISGVTSEALKALLADETFHRDMAERLYPNQLQEVKWQATPNRVQFGRRHPLRVNLPGPLKKIAGAGISVQRVDVWNLDQMTCEVQLSMALPVATGVHLRIEPSSQGIVLLQDWSIAVSIPLVGKTLAQTLEKDARQQADEEIAAMKAVCAARLA